MMAILNRPHDRRSLTNAQKTQICDRQDHCCASCGDSLLGGLTKVEFDHIKARANGGLHAVDNFQALCRDCHVEKTNLEKEATYTFQSGHESTLHPVVYEEFTKDTARSWAFVEWIKPMFSLERGFGQAIASNVVVFEGDLVRCRYHLLAGYHRGPLEAKQDVRVAGLLALRTTPNSSRGR